MNAGNEIQKNETQELFSRVVWLNARALALVLGLLFGLAVFVATNWLVIKGGDLVGPHLSLLSQYFIGYRVSFLGSIVGFVYAFAVGAASGALIGCVYNKLVEVRG